MVVLVSSIITHEVVHLNQKKNDDDAFVAAADSQKHWEREQAGRFGSCPSNWKCSPDEWLHGYYNNYEIEAHAAQIAAERSLGSAISFCENRIRPRLGDGLEATPFWKEVTALVARYVSVWNPVHSPQG
jgi:hypothetical protein